MKKIILTILCLFLLSACGTKRQYYNPEKIQGDINYNESLNANIIDWNLHSAKLADGRVISKEGLIKDFKIQKGYILLKIKDNEFFIADNDGNLKIISNNEEVYSYKFDAAVLGVDSEGDELALILADNSIVLANRSLGIKFSTTLSVASAQDNRVAAPYFLGGIIIYPTLDGKLIIFNRNDLRIVRDVVVGTENFFNNVIYLDIIDDKMIAATSKKVIVVSPNRTLYLNEDIKDIAVSGQNVFIFTKDGTIIKTDFNLRKITEKKFQFAIFIKNTIYNDMLYVFEKTGFLIKSDLNLENIEVYKIDNLVDQKSFIGNDKLFYSNKILNLK
ncbi:hypothetical protein [Campylobacter sp. US33a]|uniref:Lipoprotein, beta-barrel assembly machinery complex lipoprotein BamB n=1 Tax=Campylobacter sp. CCS1377 TaxID=3158229 RepID=A0AAU7E7B4_9BACT|nr:hypothetical protein [Campylobacter sp. US33a]MCW1360755.1 hypothetical protein [Campylobacter jejuni]TEY00556.1 hypothetical protein ELQ16_09055 [Campylobacter sp. US33a]